MAKKNSTEHCVIDTSGELPAFFCKHCGLRQPYILPKPVQMWVAMSKVFVGIHRNCRPQSGEPG
jgi:hypothetical protein